MIDFKRITIGGLDIVESGTSGDTSYIKYYIVHPMKSFVPYMKKYYNAATIFETILDVAKGVKQYSLYIDSSFLDLKIPFRIGNFVKRLYATKFFYTGTILWMSWIRLTGKYNPLEKYYG